MSVTPLLVLAAYLLGSISFAVVISRIMGLPDPRAYGSGNPGATNVLRSGRKSAAALTLLGDALKGWLAVWLAARLAPADAGHSVVLACGLAAFIGHLYPVFFRFKGGKGVATALGVLLGFNPWLGLACLATWLAVVATARISSLGAIVTALLAPLYTGWLMDWRESFWAVTALSALLLYRHRPNIRNLLAGKESRIGKGA
jgi:glycerol-3-phosphate acyltransferase PlsY